MSGGGEGAVDDDAWLLVLRWPLTSSSLRFSRFIRSSHFYIQKLFDAKDFTKDHSAVLLLRCVPFFRAKFMLSERNVLLFEFCGTLLKWLTRLSNFPRTASVQFVCADLFTF